MLGTHRNFTDLVTTVARAYGSNISVLGDSGRFNGVLSELQA